MSKGGVEFEYEEEESEPEEAAQAEGEGDPIAAQYTSFFILGYHNPIRAGCRWVAESKPFEYFILTAIIVNCVLMALNKPLPFDDKDKINIFVENAELYLLVIFCLELLVNVISLGFILHPGSYLRSPWNILDFIVVITGVLSLPELNIMKGGSVKALRAMRVLRPLKLVSGVPSLQIVMTSIAKAMIPLSNVCVLVAFVIVIYAVIGLQMLSGLYHYTCFNTGTNEIYEEGRLCGVKDGRQCPSGTECKRYWVGPNKGITSFDNIFLSMLTVFVCITCEGWTTTMYWTFDVKDANGVGFWVYFYSLNIIGAQFMLNLVLGVLSGEFAKEKERVENRRNFAKQRELEKIERQVDRYNNWIDKGEEAVVADGTPNGENGEAPPVSPNKVKIKKIMKSPAVYWFVTVCVFVNAVTSASQYYGQPKWLGDLQEIAGLLFISIFFVEMCLKIYGFGPKEYFRSHFNKFDCVVVCAGILEVVLYYLIQINLGMSVWRALKLLKLFRFTSSWESLKSLVSSLIGSLVAIASLLVLLFLFLVIFALLGMTLFGGKFSDQDEPPRTNYDDFFNALLAVFQILTGEDWNEVMYQGVIANGGPKSVGGLGHSLYFVALVILGNYTLLNVFLAIAVDNLTDSGGGGEAAAAEEEEMAKHMEEVREKYAPKDTVEKPKALQPPPKDKKEEETKSKKAGPVDEFSEDNIPTEGGTAQPGDNMLKNLQNPGRMTGNIEGTGGEDSKWIDTNTFFICFPGNPIRKLCYMIVSYKHFDNFILACILVSSALLAVEDTVDEDAKVNKILTYFDFMFTTIFAGEVVVKVINYGVIIHQGAYFRDPWNFIDALVVSCAITSLVLSNDSTADEGTQKIVKVLKVLRVLRPLKAVNKSKKLKAVFQCMIFSLKNVINILAITVMFLFVFSAMGVQLFMGKFFYCTDLSKTDEESCKGSYISFEGNDYNKPVLQEREWKVQDWNFDSLSNAMLTLFTSATGEGWPSVMFNAIDATKLNKGPLINNQIEVFAFFICFVIVLSFFFMNIFVGLIILTFQEQGNSEEEGTELDRNQRDCLIMAMTSQPLQLYVPDDLNSIQGKAYRLITSGPADSFVMLLIAGNTILLMLQFHDMPKTYESWLDELNNYFNFLFTGELIIKLIALKKNYFRDGWNVFDLIIVIGSWADFIIGKTMNSDDMPVDPSMFRLFRAARLIKLLRRGKTIKVLLWTFIQSFKALPYVGMLIFLLFFVYAIIGMQMFSKIYLGSEEEPWAQINRQNNFRSFFQAFQVLFRCATGENWPNVMMACTAPAKCDPGVKGKTIEDRCGNDFAWTYFISFIFFCSFLMLNLFVAVIMDNFGFLCQDESILGPHHMDDYKNAWAAYDPRATGRISYTECCKLLRQLQPPLGLGMKCPKIVVYKRMITMNMPLYEDDTVTYNQTMFALVRTGLGIMTENNNLKSNFPEMRKLLKRVWPNITKKTLDGVLPRRPPAPGKKTIAQIYCAKLIYEHYKHLKKQRHAIKALPFASQSSLAPVGITLPGNGEEREQTA